jgi:hypothetical protein
MPYQSAMCRKLDLSRTLILPPGFGYLHCQKYYWKILNFQAVGSLLNLTLMADDSSVLGPVITSLFWNNGSAWHVIDLTL